MVSMSWLLEWHGWMYDNLSQSTYKGTMEILVVNNLSLGSLVVDFQALIVKIKAVKIEGLQSCIKTFSHDHRYSPLVSGNLSHPHTKVCTVRPIYLSHGGLHTCYSNKLAPHKCIYKLCYIYALGWREGDVYETPLPKDTRWWSGQNSNLQSFDLLSIALNAIWPQCSVQNGSHWSTSDP